MKTPRRSHKENNWDDLYIGKDVRPYFKMFRDTATIHLLSILDELKIRPSSENYTVVYDLGGGDGKFSLMTIEALLAKGFNIKKVYCYDISPIGMEKYEQLFKKKLPSISVVAKTVDLEKEESIDEFKLDLEKRGERMCQKLIISNFLFSYLSLNTQRKLIDIASKYSSVIATHCSVDSSMKDIIKAFGIRVIGEMLVATIFAGPQGFKDTFGTISKMGKDAKFISNEELSKIAQTNKSRFAIINASLTGASIVFGLNSKREAI